MIEEKTIFVGSRSYGNTFDEYWNRIMELESKCNKYKEVLDKIKENTERTIEIIKQQPTEDDTWILERLNSNLKILEEIE